MKSKATAIWNGKGVDGKGALTTNSKVLNNVPYSYKARIGETPGTTPEELIAAAHAGCFAMKLAFTLDVAGYVPEQLDVNCEVVFEAGAVKSSTLTLKAKIAGIDKAKFDELVSESGKNCPISKLLNAEITVNGTLS